MKPEPLFPEGSRPLQHPSDVASPGRLFVHEAGWRVVQKAGSEKEFCYQMNPGQDFYHRLLDGEIYLRNNEERLCIACAERRGLLSREPKGLREPLMALDLDVSIDRGETIRVVGEEDLDT